MNEKRRHIVIGGVSLYVNKNANMWSHFTSSLSRRLDTIKNNYDGYIPVEVIVVYITPGYNNPVEFSGTRITIKSRKDPKRVQVEAAVPDISFPVHDPEQAKRIILDLMSEAVEDVEGYANRNKIIKGGLIGARNVIKELEDKWKVSDFTYKIPENLPYYDLPAVNGLTTRRFIEKMPDGSVRHYNIVLDEYGVEIG